MLGGVERVRVGWWMTTALPGAGFFFVEDGLGFGCDGERSACFGGGFFFAAAFAGCFDTVFAFGGDFLDGVSSSLAIHAMSLSSSSSSSADRIESVDGGVVRCFLGGDSPFFFVFGSAVDGVECWAK